MIGELMSELRSALKYFWQLSMQKINGIIIMSSGVMSILSPHKPWDNPGFCASVSLLLGTHIFYALHSNSMNQVESILQITTALRNGHLHSYQSHQPYYNEMSLLTHNKMTWPTNIDLGWFWHCWTVWRFRLQKKTTSKQEVKRNSCSQVRTCCQICQVANSKNGVINHCTKRTLHCNNFNIHIPSFPFWELLLFNYLTYKLHYQAWAAKVIKELISISGHGDSNSWHRSCLLILCKYVLEGSLRMVIQEMCPHWFW